MSLPPQKFREIVFQLLYSQDFTPISEEDLFNILVKELKVSKKNLRLAALKMREIEEKKSFLDEKISHYSKSFDISRIHRVEKNVLRIAVYEILFDKTLPPAVSISEANRLAKKFGSVEAVSYVNGLLDALAKKERCDDQLDAK